MRISKRVQYGIIAMVSIAMQSKDDCYVSLLDISNSNDLPLKFLENIMVNLRLNDLVISQRGCKNGGYKLARSSNEITLTEILNALDNSILCKNTHNTNAIALAIDTVVWQEVNQSILTLTDSITLSTIVERIKA
jgi:Rrf2 family protein